MNPTVEGLMKRGYLYLEDKDWPKAEEYFNRVLDMEPENARAYMGLLLSELKLESEEKIVSSAVGFGENRNYVKALRFAEMEYAEILRDYHPANACFRGAALMEKAKTEKEYLAAADVFASAGDYQDAPLRAAASRELAEAARKEAVYHNAEKLMGEDKPEALEKAGNLFTGLEGYSDAAEKAEICRRRIQQLREAEAALKQKRKRMLTIAAAAVALIAILVLVMTISANNKRAQVIYQNFLGETFRGEEEDDDGFVDDYYSNDLNPYGIYYLTTDAKTLEFRDDGSVYYTSTYSMEVLAYPKSISEPDGFYNSYDGTYGSFSVRVSLGGDVYLKLGASEYKVYVDRNNVPQTIYDYFGLTMR